MMIADLNLEFLFKTNWTLEAIIEDTLTKTPNSVSYYNVLQFFKEQIREISLKMDESYAKTSEISEISRKKTQQLLTNSNAPIQPPTARGQYLLSLPHSISIINKL